MNGLVDGALVKAAHPEQPLLDLVQIPFEMAFHSATSPSVRQRATAALAQTHPKRPVM
jgi:hypothetical protein